MKIFPQSSLTLPAVCLILFVTIAAANVADADAADIRNGSQEVPKIPLLSHPAFKDDLQTATRILSDVFRDIKLPAKGTPETLLRSLSRQNIDPVGIARRFLTQSDIRDILPKPEVVNQRCYDDVVDFIDGLIGERQNESSKEFVSKDWAVKMADSYGKLGPAYLRGALQWTGNYEQCHDVHAHIPAGTLMGSRAEPRKTSSHFDGGYCRVQILTQIPLTDKMENGFWAEVAKMPTSINWGTCFPDSCRGDDVKRLLTEGTMSVNPLNVTHVICFGNDSDLGSDGWAIVTICLYAVVGFIVVLCTSLESIAHCGYLPWVKAKDTEDAKVGQFQKLGNTDGPVTATDGNMTRSRSRGNEALNGLGLRGVDGEKPLSGASSIPATTLNVDKVRSREAPHLDGNVSTSEIEDQSTVKDRDNRRVGIGMRLLQAFSLRYNISKLCSTSHDSGPDVLNCIQGIRVLSILLIVLGHTFLPGGGARPTVNNVLFTPLDEYRKVMSRLSYMIVRAGTQAVDTFFVISGLLVMKINLRILRETEGHRVRFWIIFHVHRLWRITPVYMMVLLTGTHLYDHVTEGPLKSDPSVMFGNCPDHWWRNALYINNLFKPYEMCMPWSWFLAADMQLFLLAPIFIYLVYRKYRIGLMVLVATVVLGTLATFLIVLDNPGTFITSFFLGMEDYTKNVYVSAWPRLPVYALGLLAGIMLEDKMADKYKLSKLRAFCIWMLFLALVVFFTLIPHDQVKGEGHQWSKGVAALYEASSRLVWGLFIVWVIYACQSGLGGIVNTILTWPAFQPLARLTFAVYLVHPLVTTIFLNNRNYPVELQDTVMIYMYCGNMLMSYLFAIFITLLFESPLMTLEKIVLKR